MTTWIERLSPLPVDWLLEKACPPIRFRLLTEILDRPADDPEVAQAREAAANYKPAVTIARAQLANGTWLDKILGFDAPNPSRRRGPGLVNQFLALAEYGWDCSHPAMHFSAQLLRRYLACDTTVDLFEMRGYAGANKPLEEAIRRDLARISAALLVRGGFNELERVEEAWATLLGDLDGQYPEEGQPDLYDGTLEIEEDGTYQVARPEARIPDLFLYTHLAFHPGNRLEPRARAAAARVTRFLMDSEGPPRAVRQAEGKVYLKLRKLHIGDRDRAWFAEGRVGYLLEDLELLARTGTLAGEPKALELLDWLLGFQDPDGVLRPEQEIEKVVCRSLYHYFPLEDSWRGKHKRYTDVTFRTLLILKILDRTGTPVPG